MYQKLYYQDRILPTFQQRWAAAVAAAKEKNLPPPRQMSIRQQVVHECWVAEDEAIKTNVSEAVKLDQQARQAEIMDDRRPPATPEEYQQYVPFYTHLVYL